MINEEKKQMIKQLRTCPICEKTNTRYRLDGSQVCMACGYDSRKAEREKE